MSLGCINDGGEYDISLIACYTESCCESVHCSVISGLYAADDRGSHSDIHSGSVPQPSVHQLITDHCSDNHCVVRPSPGSQLLTVTMLEL